MNNAKMWLVVKPSTGVPLILAGVAIASFAVHVGIVSQSTWYQDYLAGREMGATATAQLDAGPKIASLLAK